MIKLIIWLRDSSKMRGNFFWVSSSMWSNVWGRLSWSTWQILNCVGILLHEHRSDRACLFWEPQKRKTKVFPWCSTIKQPLEEVKDEHMTNVDTDGISHMLTFSNTQNHKHPESLSDEQQLKMTKIDLWCMWESSKIKVRGFIEPFTTEIQHPLQ